MAAKTALRIGISPDLDIRLPINLAGLLFDNSDGLTIVPASNSPQVDALTNILSAWFI